MKLDVTNPQPAYDCPHYSNGLCSYLSSRMGVPFEATPVRCHRLCDERGGPYMGRELLKENFLPEMAKAQAKGLGPFLASRLRKHGQEVNVGIPSWWPEFKTALAPVYAQPMVKAIRLSGSSVYNPERHYSELKDLDVNLLIDPKSKLNWATIPRKFNDVRVDYFLYAEGSPNVYFPSVDPEAGEVHLTEGCLFKVKTGLKVIRDPLDPALGPIFIDMAEEARRNVLHSAKLKSEGLPPGREESEPWYKVKPSWVQALAASRLVAYGLAKLSKGLTGAKAPPETLSLRVLACHGINPEGIRVAPPCEARNYSQGGRFHFCDECRCGPKEEARLDAVGSQPDEPLFLPEDYSKLSHPVLMCPRRKKGFSNAR